MAVNDCKEEEEDIPLDYQVLNVGPVQESSGGTKRELEEPRSVSENGESINPPERCPRPLYPPDCKEEEEDIPLDHHVHKDQYKDQVMMEDHQSLTSPDGSSSINPPERCPRPLYPPDCKEEEEDIPLDHQDCKEEEEDIPLDHQFLNVGSVEESSGGTKRELEEPRSVSENGESINPPERCPHPLYPPDCKEEEEDIPLDHQVHKDQYKDQVMMEDHQSLTSPDGSSSINPPERCPRPLYPPDCKEEEEDIPLDHQDCKEEEEDIPLDHQLFFCELFVAGRKFGILVTGDSSSLLHVGHVFLNVGSMQESSGGMKRELEEPRSVSENDGSSSINPPERCPRPLYPQDCKEEEEDIPLDHQVDVGHDLSLHRTLVQDFSRI
ncbi:uncharacterized protein LOC130357519 [Hyla sarda]|uniref:uncharacterized protein LOC130357519 n=1 Tax=Hyla sarda TaxID=327740 RepID=UPI0024C2DB85|nr:uncharacterized protein LOC130357519 [Hyla sarda]